MLALSAYEPLRVFAVAGFLLLALKVVSLGININQAHPNRRNLIATDAPVDNFLRPLLGVEIPSSLSLHDRDRQWPVIRSDLQHRAIRALRHEGMMGIILLDETAQCRCVGVLVARTDQ